MEKFCPGHSNFTLHRNLFKLADTCTRADMKFQPNYAVYLNVSCQCVLQLPHLILSKTQRFIFNRNEHLLRTDVKSRMNLNLGLNLGLIGIFTLELVALEIQRNDRSIIQSNPTYTYKYKRSRKTRTVNRINGCFLNRWVVIQLPKLKTTTSILTVFYVKLQNKIKQEAKWQLLFK